MAPFVNTLLILNIGIWCGFDLVEVVAWKANSRNDICARIPSFSACQPQAGQQPQIQQPQAQSQQITQADLPPPASSPTDKAAFCKQYQAHYTYFCTEDAPGYGKAATFCRSYISNCNTDATPDASTDGGGSSTDPLSGGGSPDQREIDATCQRYKSMATSHCRGRESKMVKPYCDEWRKYCVAKPVAPAAGAAASTSSSSSASSSSSSKTKASDVPSTGSSSRSSSRSSSSSTTSSESDLRQKVQYCTRYQSAYDNYCSGKRPTGRVATFCYAYKDYCGNLPRVDDAASISSSASSSSSSSSSGRDTGSAPAPGHRRTQAPFPNYNNSAQVRDLCDRYKWMSDKACPGFEVQDLREYCNMYRVYCQGKDPVPSIDGSIGFNKDSWGVAGIPYYPFNPQGAIGGGERDTVGFGDWGGSFSQRKGVTDFWDQNKQVNANWQKGQYGYSRGWNVPLLGIGGYKNNAVNFGGILNPSDVPSLSSGGVLPSMTSGGGLPSFGGGGGGMPMVNGGLGGGLGGLGGLGNLFGG